MGATSQDILDTAAMLVAHRGADELTATLFGSLLAEDQRPGGA